MGLAAQASSSLGLHLVATSPSLQLHPAEPTPVCVRTRASVTQAASREQHCVTCATASASFSNVFNCSPDKMYRQDKVKYKPRDSN